MPIKRYQTGSHPYHSYRSRVITTPQKRFRRRKTILWVLLVFVLIAVVVGYFRYNRPLPLVNPKVTYAFQSQYQKPSVDWGQSQAAFGTVEQGVVAEKPGQSQKPTASTAKLITVLTVLDKKPLSSGEQGPSIAMTQADVDLFNKYAAVDGSTVQVAVGEQLSEYQMIQGTLLPSANNLADTLAIWAFGSLEGYKKAAQAYVERIGAMHTTVGSDASGFSPDTTSTASDLTRIGIQAAKHPVVSEVMSQKSVILPVAGEKNNTNWLLGESGVVGGKTGNTDQAGGVFVFVSKHEIGSKKYTMVGAVQGEATVRDAILASERMIQQNKSHFVLINPVRKGQAIAQYKTMWGEASRAVSSQDISLLVWKGSVQKPVISLKNLSGSVPKGVEVGTITIGEVTAPIVLERDLIGPSAQWKILSQF